MELYKGTIPNNWMSMNLIFEASSFLTFWYWSNFRGKLKRFEARHRRQSVTSTSKIDPGPTQTILPSLGTVYDEYHPSLTCQHGYRNSNEPCLPPAARWQLIATKRFKTVIQLIISVSLLIGALELQSLHILSSYHDLCLRLHAALQLSVAATSIRGQMHCISLSFNPWWS